MFNRQLKQNIKALDVEIGKLSKEVEGLKKDTKYEVKMRTLTDLTDLRCKLAKDEDKKTSSDVVVELDRQIEELAIMIAKLEVDEVYTARLQKLENLSKIRAELSECVVKESNTPAVISGVIGISAVLLVLNYEKGDIITSKAFGMLPKLFK